jgi:hypothetical protein
MKMKCKKLVKALAQIQSVSTGSLRDPAPKAEQHLLNRFIRPFRIRKFSQVLP